MLYLGCEVSVKYALAVQVLQSSGDIQRQTDPDTPRQIQITVQQLLQVTSVYILEREWREERAFITQMYCQRLLCPIFKGFTLSESNETVHSNWRPLVVRVGMIICICGNHVNHYISISSCICDL